MPMTRRRKFMITLTTLCLSLVLTIGTALAAELLGTVKSVDVDAKKIVVVPKDGGDDVEVTIKDDTEWVSAKGKMIKDYSLTKTKKGMELEIVHEKAVASKVTIKKGAPKKKVDPNTSN